MISTDTLFVNILQLYYRAVRTGGLEIILPDTRPIQQKIYPPPPRAGNFQLLPRSYLSLCVLIHIFATTTIVPIVSGTLTVTVARYDG